MPRFWEEPIDTLVAGSGKRCAMGCGKCCVHKLEDMRKPASCLPTSVSCRPRPPKRPAMFQYRHRHAYVRRCAARPIQMCERSTGCPRDIHAYRPRQDEPRDWHYGLWRSRGDCTTPSNQCGLDGVGGRYRRLELSGRSQIMTLRSRSMHNARAQQARLSVDSTTGQVRTVPAAGTMKPLAQAEGESNLDCGAAMRAGHRRSHRTGARIRRWPCDDPVG